jgi:hypothetical protein
MSVLGNLFNRIFHRDSGAQTPNAGHVTPLNPTQSANTGAQAPQPTQTMGAPQAGGAAAAATAERVDIEQVLNDMAAKNPQKLNWRTSIVDLMKLVGMDSSLQERKQLADELGYKGDKNDSAAMNIWLHKQVMKKMAENGGKVPADLLD